MEHKTSSRWNRDSVDRQTTVDRRIKDKEKILQFLKKIPEQKQRLKCERESKDRLEIKKFI